MRIKQTEGLVSWPTHCWQEGEWQPALADKAQRKGPGVLGARPDDVEGQSAQPGSVEVQAAEQLGVAVGTAALKLRPVMGVAVGVGPAPGADPLSPHLNWAAALCVLWVPQAWVLAAT